MEPIRQLHEQLSNQLEQVSALYEQINTSRAAQSNNWKQAMRETLIGIRGHIEDLRDREMQLKNNNLILRNKVFHLRQEVEELATSRRKLSPPKQTQSKPITSHVFHGKNHSATMPIVGMSASAWPKASQFSPVNVAAIHPGSFSHNSSTKPPTSPIPVETITGPQELFEHGQWRFEFVKKAMADSNQMDLMSSELGIKTLPEMVFPNSGLKISFPKSLKMSFTAVNGLKACVGEPSAEKRVLVQYAKEWESIAKSNKDVEQLHYSYDWTYTTDYKGDYSSEMKVERDVEDRFNMAMLKDMTLPILWSCHCILFEDELSDNGMSQLLVRCRVMPTCYLVLLRHWMRVDNVIIRVNDTRVFHEFGKDHVLRHYQERESKWAKLSKKYAPVQFGQFNDPNVFANKIDITRSVYDKIYL